MGNFKKILNATLVNNLLMIHSIAQIVSLLYVNLVFKNLNNEMEIKNVNYAIRNNQKN